MYGLILSLGWYLWLWTISPHGNHPYSRPFGFVAPKTFKLFGFPIFWPWAYLVKVIPETQLDIYVFISTMYNSEQNICPNVRSSNDKEVYRWWSSANLFNNTCGLTFLRCYLMFVFITLRLKGVIYEKISQRFILVTSSVTFLITVSDWMKSKRQPPEYILDRMKSNLIERI